MRLANAGRPFMADIKKCQAQVPDLRWFFACRARGVMVQPTRTAGILAATSAILFAAHALHAARPDFGRAPGTCFKSGKTGFSAQWDSERNQEEICRYASSSLWD